MNPPCRAAKMRLVPNVTRAATGAKGFSVIRAGQSQSSILCKIEIRNTAPTVITPISAQRENSGKLLIAREKGLGETFAMSRETVAGSST